MRPNNKRPQDANRLKKDIPRIVWFKATDKRVPLIAIPTEQVPNDFVENSQRYATTLFVVSIHREKI